MSTVEAIEQAVERLDKNDLASFREWFHAFESSEWDSQIERDVTAGKLDALADEAIAEFRSAKTRQL